MRGGVRLPLQIGTTSLWSMTRAALLLVPGVLLLPFGLVGGIGALYVGDGGEVSVGIAAVLIGTPFMLIWIALLQLGGMLRARPSDAVLDAAGLRVEGGVHGGVQLPWAQLDPRRCSLRDVTDKQLTLGDMYKTEQEATGTAMTHLVVERDEQAPLVLAEAEAPEERASLAALFASIQAGAWRGEAEEAGPVDADVVRCAGCGAAVVPGTDERVKCHRCGAAVAMPEDVRRRVQTAAEGRSARQQAAGLVTRLIDQPGAVRINLLFVLGGAAMLLAWPGSLGIGIWNYLRDDLDATRVLSLLVFPLALIPGLYALLRMQLVDRFALRLLTLDLGAREPARAGDPYGCHACGAPLVVGPGEVVVRCVYCAADNVLGLDLRARTGRERAAARSLDEALRWRSKERTHWRWRVVPALVLTALGVLLLWRAVRPTPRTHELTVLGGVLERVTEHPADERMPTVARDGRLALVRGDEDPIVVVAGEEVDRGTWPAWDADGAILALRGGQAVRIADGGGFLRPMFGAGLTRIAGSGALAVSFADGMAGISSTALLGAHGADGGHAHAGVRGRDAAVSADGQRLAFVREVDGVAQLFSTGVGSAGALQWTTDAGDKGQPTWSPDGRRLVYVVDKGTAEDPERNLWIAADDGSAGRVLTMGDADATDPFWAGDGWVYFAAHAFGRSDIFRVDPDDDPPGDPREPDAALFAGPAGVTVERVTDDVHFEHDPALSPDGTLLAFCQTHSVDGDIKHMGIVVRDLRGGGDRVLQQFRGDPPKSLQWARSPAWAPDGTLVFVLASEFVTMQRIAVGKALLDAEQLMDAGSTKGSLVRPRVAPDGQTIVLERRASADAPWEIVVRAGDGSVTAVGPGTRAAWRADGQAFAFVRTENRRGRVMLATLADPTHPTPVELGDRDVRGVAMHPDGRWILEVGLGPDRAELEVVDGSGNAEKLVVGPADSGRHSVGSDGWVYFTSDALGQLDVWRVQLRGA